MNYYYPVEWKSYSQMMRLRGTIDDNYIFYTGRKPIYKQDYMIQHRKYYILPHAIAAMEAVYGKNRLMDIYPKLLIPNKPEEIKKAIELFATILPIDAIKPNPVNKVLDAFANRDWKAIEGYYSLSQYNGLADRIDAAGVLIQNLTRITGKTMKQLMEEY